MKLGLVFKLIQSAELVKTMKSVFHTSISITITSKCDC